MNETIQGESFKNWGNPTQSLQPLGLNMPSVPTPMSEPIAQPFQSPVPKGSGTMLGTAIAPGIGTIVGSVVDIGLNLYGQHKQDKVNAENRKIADQWAAIQNEIAKKESARQWKWLEEDRSYGQAMDFQKNMWNMLQTDVSLKNNLVSLYRRSS